MRWQYHYGAPPLFITVAVSLALIVVIVRRRNQQGAISLLLLVAGAGLWALGDAMELGSLELATKIPWARFRYLGIVTIPVAWLVFALQFARLKHWLVPRLLIPLCAIPALNLAMVWTDHWHHLFFREEWLDVQWGVVVLASRRGPWYFVNVATSYAYVLMGTVLLVRTALRAHQVYRRQTILLVAAGVFPMAANILFQLRLSPVPYMDFTPLTFSVAAFIFTWTFIRHGLLFLPMPVAKAQVLDSVHDGILVLDMERRVLDANNAALLMFNTDPKALISRPISDILDVPDPMFSDSAGRTAPVELPAPTPEVPDRVLEATVSPLRKRLAGTVGNVLILRDVSERKRAELELRRLSTAMEHTVEDILITGLDGRIIYANPAFERVTGYHESEVLGERLGFLRSNAHETESLAEMWKLLKAGETWQGTVTNRRKDGKFIRQAATVSPISDEKHVMVGYVSVRRDVTEQEQLQAMLQYSQKTEALGRLAGGMAHDFNNMLTPVIGYAEMVIESLDQDDERRKDLEQIVKAASRARDLTNQLLAVGRRQVLAFRPVDINRTILDLLDMLRTATRENIQIIHELAPGLKAVRGDVAQIEQVIVNLVLNAQESMPAEGRLTLRTSGVSADDVPLPPGRKPASDSYVCLSVTDTGAGIPAEAQEHLFEPFFTAKSGEVKTGLELAMVHGIVEQHGGAVSLASRGGEGTTIAVYLPVMEEAPAQGESASDARSLSEAMAKGAILLVEDNDMVRRMVSIMLGKTGFDVAAFASGPECLAAVASGDHKPVLLMTDAIMPEMNGRELITRIRELFPNLPALLMSGHVDEFTAGEDLTVKGVSFLQKPFRSQELEAALRDSLRQPTVREDGSPRSL